jgi:hypothetical protein
LMNDDDERELLKKASEYDFSFRFMWKFLISSACKWRRNFWGGKQSRRFSWNCWSSKISSFLYKTLFFSKNISHNKNIYDNCKQFSSTFTSTFVICLNVSCDDD